MEKREGSTENTRTQAAALARQTNVIVFCAHDKGSTEQPLNLLAFQAEG